MYMRKWSYCSLSKVMEKGWAAVVVQEDGSSAGTMLTFVRRRQL